MKSTANNSILLSLVCLAQVVIGLATPHENHIRQQEFDFNTNLTDTQTINLLSSGGRCPYYPVLDQSFTDISLAACNIWCPNQYGDNSGNWNCTFDWASTAPSAFATYYDENNYSFLIGNCSCSNITESVTINSTFFANPAKEVQDLSAWGYQFTGDDFQDPRNPQPEWHLWEFELPGLTPKPRIGIFGVERDGSQPGTLIIEETIRDWARRDRRQNRAHLSDQTLSFWKLSPLHRDLNDLHTLYFYAVMEESLNQLRPVVYQKMGATMPSDLTVRRYTDSAEEWESFDLLLNGCKFCKAAQRSIDQYIEFNHREIVGFRFSMAGLVFEIFYDGSGI